MSTPSKQEGAIAKLRSAALVEILERVAKHDAEIVDAANKACEIDSVDDGMALLQLPAAELHKLGWASKRELRIAIDAKKNGKEVPFYLKMANDRACLRWRDGHGDGANKGSKPSMVVLPITVQPASPAAPAGRVIIDGKAVGEDDE